VDGPWRGRMAAAALERGTERGRQRVDAYASKECWAHE
jgi:hypothetical protein